MQGYDSLDTKGAFDKFGMQCNCLHGQPYVDASGNCGCLSPGGIVTTQLPPLFPKTQLMPKVVYLSNGKTTSVPVQTDPAAVVPFDLKSWVQDNKFIVGGLALALIVLFMMRGGGFKSREITSVTRYGK
jgi:hypothetical protein